MLGGETPIVFTAAINPVRVSSVDKHDVLHFDNVITDIGAGYNNQTGIFVVPESGVYMFLVLVAGRLSADHGARRHHAQHARSGPRVRRW